VKPAPPAVAELGEMLVMVTGLMVKLTLLETPPPGLATVTAAVPALEIELATTVVVNCVALT
jgi:hypothetical protein